MNITKEHTSELEARLKVQITEDDYREKVEKSLKDIQKKANIPGFRPGKVPSGLIKKMYWKTVLLEEVNKVMSESLYDYIKSEKLPVLGSPLADQNQGMDIDWDTQKEFDFTFEIGMSPEINISLDDAIPVDYYKIKVEDKTVQDYVEDICRRNGEMAHPEVSEEDDLLFGEFVETDGNGTVKENGHSHKSNLYIKFVKDEDLKKQMIGCSIGAVFTFDIIKASENEVEASSMIGLKKEELETVNPVFRFTVENISRLKPSELNQALYDKVAPGLGIESEEAFRNMVKEQVSKQFDIDSDRQFKLDAIKKLVDISGFDLPDNFLKKWLIDQNTDQLNAENIDEEYHKYRDTLKWQLIENKIASDNKVDVTPEEIKNHLKAFMADQMLRYGQSNIEEEMLENFAKRIMADEKEVKNAYDRLFDDKVFQLLKNKLQLNIVELTYDDFVKLVAEKHKAQ